MVWVTPSGHTIGSHHYDMFDDFSIEAPATIAGGAIVGKEVSIVSFVWIHALLELYWMSPEPR